MVMVTGPPSWLLLLVVNTLLGTTQEVVVGQFRPVITIWAFAVLKLLPLTVSEKVPAVTLVGEMLWSKAWVHLPSAFDHSTVGRLSHSVPES